MEPLSQIAERFVTVAKKRGLKFVTAESCPPVLFRRLFQIRPAREKFWAYPPR